MEKLQGILFSVPQDALAGPVLLFKTLADWTGDALAEAGIEQVVPADRAEAAAFSDAEIFAVSAQFPLLPAFCISSALEQHRADGTDLTVLADVDGAPAGLWLRPGLLQEQDLQARELSQLLCSLEARGLQKSVLCAEEGELFAVRNAHDLFLANEAARTAVIDRALSDGVLLFCDDGVILSPDARIAPGAQILPGTIIRGKSVIGAGAVIGPNTLIDNSSIGERSIINACQVFDSTVGSDTKIGPFTQLRPNSHIGNGVKIGDFVEIKNSTVGDQTAVAHLTYVGDSDVGRRVNFGCGTVTVNYDGKNKHRTEIGDWAFIGCNTNLIAPVKIGKNAFTAAGSTVTQDVPDDSLCVSRAREQRVIEGWVEKRLGRRRFEKQK